MGILFTADWQAEWSNLDLCLQVGAEITEICKREKLSAVCILGDLKRAYNPVDVRVVKFWQSQIHAWRYTGLEVYILLGNHDRIGQYDDKQNWLSILGKAGARIYDTPEVIGPVAGYHLHMLPFMSDVDEMKRVCQNWTPDYAKPSLLLFHCDIRNARYNKLRRRSDASFKRADFLPDRYLACIGGHIHDHQKLGSNVWYTGSPFCTDWGEANQTKGYIVVQDAKLRFVVSSIPGWYDNTWPGFPQGRKNWEGTRIRIHVPCRSTQAYGSVLERSRRDAERLYQGATLVVVPEFQEQDKKSALLKTTDPDSVKIKAYVEQTVPKDLRADTERLSQYLIRKLEQVVGHSVRSVSGIKFTKATAENFLSFKKVSCDFQKPGITVVRGINHDWQGRSNGAGKTSFLQLIPVALFGTTFKGQKHDRWARRSSSDHACVEVTFEDGRGRKCGVTRSRRPSAIRFSIGGRDHSSGLRGDARDGTQGLIEQLTGFTWQTLANSVYIDPAIAHAFLSGTRKERSQVLARFQNLERFEKALVEVKIDARINESALFRAQNELDTTLRMLDVAKRNLEELRGTLRQIDRDADVRVAALHKRYMRLEAAYVDMSESHVRKLRAWQKRYAAAQQSREADCAQMVAFSKRLCDCAEAIRDLASLDLGKKTHCPTCLQPVKGAYVQDTLAALRKMERKLERQTGFWNVKVKNRDAVVRFWENKLATLTDRAGTAKATADRAKESWENAKKFRSQDQELRRGKEATRKQKDEITHMLAKRQMLLRARNAHKESQAFYEYAQQAFSRDGIPAFLSQQLVPVLNKEADYYADLFCDRTVQIRFEVINGDFDVKTINASGGEDTEDQSTGERACAGLIASFALRSIAPRSNVLVLDEPGAGLDVGNSGKFAQALRVVSRRFGSVFITSHNPSILAELDEEHTITVEKKKGVSTTV